LSQGAALRFLLTRVFDALNTVEGAIVKIKDPIEYLKRLEFHKNAKSFEDYLKGSHGVQFYQVDAYGREVGYVDDFPPINPEPGRNIITTIDINIQY